MFGGLSKRRPARVTLVLAALLALTLVAPASGPPVAAQSTELAEALVLVNSSSARYDDFEQLVQPYLDHWGLPYTLLDIGTQPLTANIGRYALIVVGHRQIDLSGSALSATEEGYIRDAVLEGSGLLNLDGDVAEAGVGRYLYIDTLFGFIYKTPAVDYGVTFPIASGSRGTVIECAADAHQNPVLPTLPQSTVVDVSDGLWTEMDYPPRPEPALMAGLDEEPPVMHCFGDVPNGSYQVWADLYTGSFGHDLTYYYGYTAGSPKAQSVDTVGRSGGEDRFGEYNLGTVTVSDGTFDIYFRDADARAIPGPQASREALQAFYAQQPDLAPAQATFFGWSSIRLVPTGTPAPTMPWITARREPDEWIGTGSLEMSGIDTIGPDGVVVARSNSEPLLVAASAGQGRAVHWASYDWMYYAIKGPMYGLDDLVWRGAVWAARKPFVLQGLPPLVTMRVDDAVGPFDWIEAANSQGLKPWAGLFYKQVDDTAAAQLAGLVNAGQATAAVHAQDPNVTTTGDFYYDHGVGDMSDAEVAAKFADATAWFNSVGLPISRFVLPQFYELGTNVFEELQTPPWNVDLVGVAIVPGTDYGTPWINNGPFRLDQEGSSDSGHPLTYAGFLDQDPAAPTPAGQFFNCLTEIRDDAGYEWFPNNDIAGSIGRGTRQLKRALDAMTLPTLFTHEPYLQAIDPANLSSILQGISANLGPYQVQGVTMDQACQYVRAMHTSAIDSAVYDPGQGMLTVTLTGSTDLPTYFYLFTDAQRAIEQRLVTVAQFTGQEPVTVRLGPGAQFQIYLPLALKGYMP